MVLCLITVLSLLIATVSIAYWYLKETKVNPDIKQGKLREVIVNNVCWQEVYSHDFREGYPESGNPPRFGWGDISLTDEGVQLNPGNKYCGLIFAPYKHSNEWMMETQVKFINSTYPAKASILTRDGGEVNDESAFGICLDSSQATVRHMTNKTNQIYEVIHLTFKIRENEWYKLRFAYYNSTVECYINDSLVYRKTGLTASLTDYTEPHLAVFNGTAIFQYIRIYQVEET